MSHGYDDVDSGGAGTTLGVQGSGARVKNPLTRKEKIQEELKLLEWHKLANDAAIKASLMQNAQLKKAAPHDIPTHTEDDAKWMKKVIQQEHIKPLEVNKEYVLEYERREKENEERLTMQVERHIGTLQKLRSKLEAKADMKKRSDDYRAWNRTFNVKKQEVMLGKTLAEIENVDMGASSGKENKPVLMPTKRNAQRSSELGSVLESLDKLSELENRITSLEKDNVYERMVQSERPSADRRTVMDFKKSRAVMGPEDQPGKGPKAVVYSMRPKQKSWQVEVPGITKKTVGGRGGGGGGKIPPLMNRSGQQPQDFDDEGGGTFLTGIDAGEGRVANPKLDRARKLHDASSGQKNMRTRVQVKKSRLKEDALGTRKHEQALAELNRRRNEQQIQKRPPRGLGVASKGAAAGVKTSNRHLNDFNKTKDQMKSRVASIKRGAGEVAAGGRGGNSRIASKTAPALSNTGGFDDAMLGSGAMQRRMPHTRGGAGGTGGNSLTRRVADKTPQRRSMGGRGEGGASTDEPSSAPAVGGVGGIRALRNNRSSSNQHP